MGKFQYSSTNLENIEYLSNRTYLKEYIPLLTHRQTFLQSIRSPIVQAISPN